MKYTYIGKAVPKLDARDKATGKALYIHDLKLPGMLFGKILRSRYPHARILHIDTDKAKKLAGVAAVLTADDLPDARFGIAQDNWVLKKGKVRSLRDEVAAVAAVDLDTAMEALELIEVVYEPLPTIFDPHEAREPGAPIIQERYPDNISPIAFHFSVGQVAEGFRQSHLISEDTFKLPFIAHCCLGTSGCIAQFDASGGLTIWGSTQIPFLLQRELAELLGIPGHKLRIIQATIGGAFGSKLDMYPFEPICAFLARFTDRPVKILYTREEEFLASPTRQPAEITIKTGVSQEGKLQARQINVFLDNGAYTSWGVTTPYVMMLPATSLYGVPHLQFDSLSVYTNNAYSGAMRGYGNPQMTFALESQMDMLAEKLGLEPLDFRQRNANAPLRENEAYQETPQGLRITRCAFGECLEKVAVAIRWQEKRAAGRGVGLASMFHVGGGGRVYRSDGCGCFIKVDDFGGVNLITGATEIGQGSETAIAQIVAEELGVSIDRIKVINQDTDVRPWDVGVHASRTTFIAGNAALRAAQDVKKKILQAAAPMLKVEEERLCIQDNCIFSSTAPEQKIPLEKVVRAAHFTTGGTLMLGYGYYDPPTVMADKNQRGNVAPTYSFGAMAVEVEVDPETGQVTLLHCVSAVDVGQVINGLGLEGQMEGGAVMGFGYALSEQLVFQEGKLLNPHFHDYKLMTTADVCEIQTLPIETHEPEGPFGAKGVGEAGTIMAAAAVANAIARAVGVRITELPITPEKIVMSAKNGPKPIPG